MTDRVDTKGMIKTNVHGYFKKPKTNVVINADESGLNAYRHGVQKTIEMNELRSELDKIKKALGLN